MKATANKILIPVDFSEQSLVALGQTYNLAREYNAELTLLYVIEETNILSRFFTKQQDEDVKKTIQKELDELAADVEKKSGRVVNTLIARGSVYDKISEIAEVINATFIIMGTNGATGIKKKFIGSNALRVVREAKCPVITIRGKYHRNGCKNIVLPLDLTKETREKVGKAIELAKLANSTIHVISLSFSSDDFVANRLSRQLNQVATFIEKHNVECTAEIIKGAKGEESLAQTIIDYAHKVEADLIMIMTQQEVDFTDYFIGSSAQEIINNSDIPVLSIRPTLKRDHILFPSEY